MAKPSAFDAMMHELCVGKGWCGSVIDGAPSHVTDYIPDKGEVSAEQFVDWLIKADGEDPSQNSPQMRRVKTALIDVFIKYMGAQSVDAARLRFSDSE